jgi:hypothetical protein
MIRITRPQFVLSASAEGDKTNFVFENSSRCHSLGNRPILLNLNCKLRFVDILHGTSTGGTRVTREVASLYDVLVKCKHGSC